MKHLLLLALLAVAMLMLTGCRDPGPAVRNVQRYNRKELSKWNDLKQEWRAYLDTEREKWPKW